MCSRAPVVAWVLHGLTVWLWHVPALFDAALRSQAVHELQHFSFFASELLFWWVALAPRPAGISYLFTTMVHTGALGGLITFAPTVWYLAIAMRRRGWAWTRWRTSRSAGSSCGCRRPSPACWSAGVAGPLAERGQA
jgi:hypothetical protein